jgi:hypothetical protein
MPYEERLNILANLADKRKDAEVLKDLETWGHIKKGVQPTEVHSITITPQMRKELLEQGQPLYSIPPMIPVHKSMQSDEKKQSKSTNPP